MSTKYRTALIRHPSELDSVVNARENLVCFDVECNISVTRGHHFPFRSLSVVQQSTTSLLSSNIRHLFSNPQLALPITNPYLLGIPVSAVFTHDAKAVFVSGEIPVAWACVIGKLPTTQNSPHRTSD